ncbi:MAG: mannose-1-phosphate guanylyltransferase/mannose-6-phosphate isomerase [Alphaproteobacteria bacterium]|nr:mannose-1-phosphate guanylyltransferase/mannose-6-phosphate isomerase [Alphaproteobacteria bacterium]
MTRPSTADKFTPVLLSGGAGTRLWPLSRTHYPKQLLALTGKSTLLQLTAMRVSDPARFRPPIVVASAAHRFAVAEQLDQIGVRPAALVLEPVGRNTAPAIAAAALAALQAEADPLLAVMPTDHLIRNSDAFLAALEKARVGADRGFLVTFGVVPDRAETGYGYVLPGPPLAEAGDCLEVVKFVEKPDRATAERYVAERKHLWNSGMFVFRARRYLDTLARYEPEMARRCQDAIDRAKRDLDFVRLDSAAMDACPSQSIDYAVMERTDRAAVVPADFGWNDVGSFDQLWHIGAKDSTGNVVVGKVTVEDGRGNYLHSERRLLAVLGVNNLVVVCTDDSVMVADRERTQDVRRLVARLKETGHDEPDVPPVAHRPWGIFQRLESGDRFQVKQIVVKPGGRLSLQYHAHRAEHWVVVQGRAQVTVGQRVFTLEENQSTFIPAGTHHRLENPQSTPLRLIEIQSGDYLGEDDIVRVEDSYGRD